MVEANSRSSNPTRAASAGTLLIHNIQFIGLLVGTVVIVGWLTFFPALALGPVAEHFAMQVGLTY
jgi:K+-transporting ATPase ATPase A chain